ncbi:hypothetical protein DFJ58DRAFT_720603 [Suillus subalutaceus]|uniref:uncharacterized protein n=1 Tax=Suillus subalutaceus TaxID=48586 RepID=UPI001B886B9C|nr:uncharacterized protein DFJ58DRAFT_720603 [Suillus subalutaceus]KAG1877839.1 hypothetical protein DFJ58DRAFT_720603 [Suillus subalutaceus]
MATQLIATALAAMCNNNILVEDYTLFVDPWDGNDYAILKSVVMGIDVGSFDVKTLKWPGQAAFKDGTNHIQWFVIPALGAYMKAKKVTALLTLKDGWNVNDMLTQLDNDHAYLTSFLGADNKAHPMFTFLN